jgi:hypothetical protein
MNDSKRKGKRRPSVKALNNEEFFNHVISVWGLEETQLRQSIYFSFVASEILET